MSSCNLSHAHGSRRTEGLHINTSGVDTVPLVYGIYIIPLLHHFKSSQLEADCLSFILRLCLLLLMDGHEAASVLHLTSFLHLASFHHLASFLPNSPSQIPNLESTPTSLLPNNAQTSPCARVFHVFQGKGYGFVEMRSVEETSNAMAFDGAAFKGVYLKVKCMRLPAKSCTVYVPYLWLIVMMVISNALVPLYGVWYLHFGISCSSVLKGTCEYDNC
jgi:hypothetical protein